MEMLKIEKHKTFEVMEALKRQFIWGFTSENYIPASQTQQATIKGRQLDNVLLNIKSAIDYVNDISQHPLALLQLDFAKAFDNVSHKFILSLIGHIKLPPALIQWTTILLQDISAKILVNHTLTDHIPITTGIRQGCSLNMLLFFIARDTVYYLRKLELHLLSKAFLLALYQQNYCNMLMTTHSFSLIRLK